MDLSYCNRFQFRKILQDSELPMSWGDYTEQYGGAAIVASVLFCLSTILASCLHTPWSLLPTDMKHLACRSAP